jgi:hypothetical protein
MWYNSCGCAAKNIPVLYTRNVEASEKESVTKANLSKNKWVEKFGKGMEAKWKFRAFKPI